VRFGRDHRGAGLLRPAQPRILKFGERYFFAELRGLGSTFGEPFFFLRGHVNRRSQLAGRAKIARLRLPRQSVRGHERIVLVSRPPPRPQSENNSLDGVEGELAITSANPGGADNSIVV